MSEPLTSHEIEDVLSSIRRLVSEDLRPAVRQAAATAPKRAEPEAGKLMLTPALRVVPQAEIELPAEPAPEVAAAPELTAQETLESILEDGLAPAEVSSAGAMAGFAPLDDVYDDLGLDEGDSGLKVLMDSSTPAAPEGETDELIWSAPGEAVPEADLIMPASDDVLADTTPMQDPHGHWTTQDVSDVDWAEAEADWAESEADPVPFVAHPRAMASSTDPLARAWADRAEAEVRAELEAKLAAARAHVVEPRAEASTAELFEGDESEIDEEALRDIVRDIIREELAGALGERITRNVRKLVRVEINRALTAREFE